MRYELTTTPAGVRVVTEPMPSVRSVAFGLWFGVGSRDENAAQAGCSHFLEHLLFKGTSRRSARAIAEELDAVGGEMNAFTSKELTCFYARVLDDDLPLAADVLTDMAVRATNTPADVDAERQVVLSEIDIHLDSPDDLVNSDFSELLLGDHPLALEILGSAEGITALPRDTIHAYYEQHYRPEELTVAAAGNVDHDQVVALVDQLAGDLGRPGGGRPPRTPPASYGAGAVRVRHRPTEQAHVVLGTPGLRHDDERRYTLRVLNALLGGGMSSRLFQEIREARGLAYTTFSYAAGYTDAGILAAYAGTAPGKVDEVLKVLGDELDRVADDVTAEEVERAKGAIRGGLVLGMEDTGSRMGRLGKQVATGAEIVTIDEAIAAIDTVDLDAVRDLAATMLAAPRCLAIVGPFDEDATDRFTPYVA